MYQVHPRLARQYVAEQAGNTLAPYLCGLEACAERGETVDDAEYGVYGGGASDIAAQRLGQPFLAAWADAANRDPVFRKAVAPTVARYPMWDRILNPEKYAPKTDDSKATPKEAK